MDKLLQCLRLLALMLSCYGYLRACMKMFKLPAEFALVVALTGIGLAMFLGGLLGLLLPTAYLLLAAGVVLAGLSLRRRESLRPLFTPGIGLWLLLSGFSLYLVYGQVFYYIDNFSHWATAVKVLLAKNAFPGPADYHIYFPKYPLGSTVLVYYFARLSGIQSEWFQMLVQAVYISACLSALSRLVPQGRAWLTALSYAGVGLFALAVLGCNIELTSLYVDNLMPLVGLNGVWLWLYTRRREESFVPLLLICCYVVTIKQSGIFFAAAIILVVFFDREHRGQALILTAATAVVKLLWSAHVRHTFGSSSAGISRLSLVGLFPGFADKTADDVNTIISGMLHTLCQPAALLPVLGLTGLALALAAGCESRRRFRRLALGGLAFYLIYCAGQGAMYIFFMPQGEAVRLAAFERYFATIQIFTAGYFLALLLTELRKQKRGLPGQALGLAACCALCLLALAPNPAYYIRTEKRVPSFLAETNELLDLDWARAEGKPAFWASIRSEFDRVIAAYHIPQGLTYTIFIGEDYGIETRVLANYLLSSAGTTVCTDAELAEKGESCKTYDYYIVLEETEANMALIQRLFHTDARAGYTIDLQEERLA